MDKIPVACISSKSCMGLYIRNLFICCAQKTVEVRPEMIVKPTEFGFVKAHAGRIEEHPLTGARFVKEE